MNINQHTKKQLSEVPLHEFVGDLDLRWKRTNGLIDNILSHYNNPKILDLALGSGHDSIFLLKTKILYHIQLPSRGLASGDVPPEMLLPSYKNLQTHL